jgi:hypothetical protein
MTLDKSPRLLKLREDKYFVVKAKLHWKEPNGLLLRGMLEEEVEFFIKDVHQWIFSGHYAARETM